MSEHSTEHEELILAVVAGDVPAGAPEVARRARECARCAAELVRLRAVAARLDEEARQELALLATSERMADAPGGDRIEAFREHPEFRRYGAERTSRGPAPRWVAVAAGLAAAALLLAVLRPWESGGARPDGGERTQDDRMLGDEDPDVRVLPFDGFDRNLALRFTASDRIRPDVAQWDVIVEGTGADGSHFREVYTDVENPWSSPSAVSRFPATVTITVHALNASGRVLGSSKPLSGSRSP